MAFAFDERSIRLLSPAIRDDALAAYKRGDMAEVARLISERAHAPVRVGTETAGPETGAVPAAAETVLASQAPVVAPPPTPAETPLAPRTHAARRIRGGRSLLLAGAAVIVLAGGSVAGVGAWLSMRPAPPACTLGAGPCALAQSAPAGHPASTPPVGAPVVTQPVVGTPAPQRAPAQVAPAPVATTPVPAPVVTQAPTPTTTPSVSAPSGGVLVSVPPGQTSPTAQQNGGTLQSVPPPPQSGSGVPWYVRAGECLQAGLCRR